MRAAACPATAARDANELHRQRKHRHRVFEGGGGVRNGFGTATLTNCTLSGNTAAPTAEGCTTSLRVRPR